MYLRWCVCVFGYLRVYECGCVGTKYVRKYVFACDCATCAYFYVSTPSVYVCVCICVCRVISTHIPRVHQYISVLLWITRVWRCSTSFRETFTCGCKSRCHTASDCCGGEGRGCNLMVILPSELACWRVGAHKRAMILIPPHHCMTVLLLHKHLCAVGQAMHPAGHCCCSLLSGLLPEFLPMRASCCCSLRC